VKRVVPFLKVDKGLQVEKDGVQMMKPMPQLAPLLDKAKSKRIFGTKMRAVIKQANSASIKNIVSQQFEIARQIIAADLIPIIEPEIDIHCPDKSTAETLLKTAILEKLNGLQTGQQVMLKFTLPERADLYADCVHHPRVLRLVALSGGYTREEADDRLRKNHGVVASFSRALLEGLSNNQTDAEFDTRLDGSIRSIYEASIT
jgi:fructose-bisphosphate aldolase class I